MELLFLSFSEQGSKAVLPSNTHTTVSHLNPPFLSPFLWLVTNYYSTLRTLFWDMGDGSQLGFLVGDGNIQMAEMPR